MLFKFNEYVISNRLKFYGDGSKLLKYLQTHFFLFMYESKEKILIYQPCTCSSETIKQRSISLVRVANPLIDEPTIYKPQTVNSNMLIII